MNAPEEDVSGSRWANEVQRTAAPVAPAERAALREVLDAIRRVRHGSVHLSLQDGRVVQVEVTEKRRL